MITKKLFKPIDNSQLVLFRIIFGLLITLEAWGAILTGWVHRVFIEPSMNFPFLDFDFLHPLPGNGMIYYFMLMGSLGVMVMLGFKYRVAIVGYTLMWSAAYFMQKTSYNNHYYLLVLFNFIFCFVPAHHSYSLDAKWNSSLKREYCLQWHVWIFKAMILTVYFYSAVAKMYPDWINAVPIKIWFEQKSDYWLVGDLLAQEWFQYFVAWGGIIYDLLIGPALLWKKSRKYAFVASLFFHLFNSAIFQVGIFPFLGISFAMFFYDAEKIRKVFLRTKPTFRQVKIHLQPWYRKIVIIGLTSFLTIQILLPLRHWYFVGDVNWTEEGHRLSWRMMLRSKGGYVNLYIEDRETKERTRVDLDNYLTPKQKRVMATRPDMLWYFVQQLKEEHRREGKDYAIYANGLVSLNGATGKALYDSKVDLSQAEWNRFSENNWILRD